MRIRVLALALAATGLMTAGASAADYGLSPGSTSYNPAAFNFNGFYLGAEGGLTSVHSIGSLGVVAGVNFDIADPVLAGIEFQGDWLLTGSPSTPYNFFALGRLGVVVTPELLVYGVLGPAWVAGTPSYALGAGAEYALTDTLSVKGEVIGTGTWGAGPSSAKIQAGLLFHLQ